MLGVSVQGGTGAGRRRVKISDNWHCECVVTLAQRVPQGFAGEVHGPTVKSRSLYEAVKHGVTLHRVHPGDRYSCPDCGTRRPA